MMSNNTTILKRNQKLLAIFWLSQRQFEGKKIRLI